MKKTQILVMITLSLHFFCGFSFSPVAQGTSDMDPYLLTFERLKEEGDFENWPCKDGPIRAGIILSKDDFSALQEAEEDSIPNIYIFVRNNIYVEISAREGMRTEIKSIAEELDQLLLLRPTGDEALELIPVIKGIHASKTTIKPNNVADLTVDIEFPEGNPGNLNPTEDFLGRVTNKGC